MKVKKIRSAFRWGGYFFLEKLLRWCPHPKMRGQFLKILGARIGHEARIHEVCCFNLHNGFRNLWIGDHSHIGAGCFIDLLAPVKIGQGTSISPRCLILTHSDPGNELGSIFPRKVKEVTIGSQSWIGAGSIILCGVSIGNGVVVGAGTLVNKDIPDNSLAIGNPVQIVNNHARQSSKKSHK